jgi:hypothetical protein
MQDALWARQHRLLLEPLATIVISSAQAPAAYIFKLGSLCKCALQLSLGQIQSEIVNLLFGIFKCLQKKTDFTQISIVEGKKAKLGLTTPTNTELGF